MNATTGRFPGMALGVLGLFAIALSLGCGGGGGGTISPNLVASFTASGTAVSPNGVRLRSTSASGDTIVLDVAIGGPTTSGDLYSFAFDLVLSDVSVASYVNGSATVGNALTPMGGQALSAQATQSGNRLVVGVTKLGGGSGNGVAASEAIVVRLTFRVLRVGTTTVTFSGAVSAQNPTGGPAVLDSTGTLIPSVQFDSTPAAISGS